jgi:hypothetical protein
MKPIIPFALLGALLAVGAADAAVTDPVGYITHTVAPNGGSGERLTIIGPTLVQPNVFAGASTNDPSGTASVSFTGGVPALDSTFLIEITSGPAEGWWSTVASVGSTATSVSTANTLPAGLAVGTKFAVRKHNTVLSFLGQNNPGLAPFGAPSPDEVQFLVGGTISPIVYATTAAGAPADGWYFTSDFSSADSRVIEPGTGLLIKNTSNSTLTFTSSGSVKITDTEVSVAPGLTLIAQTAAAGANIDATGFPTELIQFDGSNGDFDQLQFLPPDQILVSFAALAPGVAGPTATMGNLGTGLPDPTAPFAEGVGAIIKRDPSKLASSILLQGSVVAP